MKNTEDLSRGPQRNFLKLARWEPKRLGKASGTVGCVCEEREIRICKKQF